MAERISLCPLELKDFFDERRKRGIVVLRPGLFPSVLS
jgi:hypothetical protein